MKLNLEYYKEELDNKLIPEEYEEVLEKVNSTDSDFSNTLDIKSKIKNILALSDIRENILNWYDFKKDCKILDDMLTRLIIDERKYDPDCEFVGVINYYINYVNDDTKFLYLAEDNDNIMGYIFIKIENDKAKIDALFVDEKYRKQGIATKLIEDAISYVKEKKIKVLTINVLSNNLEAKNLYLKFFKPFKEELKLDL